MRLGSPGHVNSYAAPSIIGPKMIWSQYLLNTYVRNSSRNFSSNGSGHVCLARLPPSRLVTIGSLGTFRFVCSCIVSSDDVLWIIVTLWERPCQSGREVR